VLQSLWNALTGLFWGYSGADLKLDVDYLKLLSTAPTAKGFFWNLYATRDYREEPNEFVQQLVSAFDGRAIVCHEPLLETLGSLVAFVPPAPAASEDAGALQRQRNEALIASLAAWAKQSVRPMQASEAFARFHDGTGDFARALECYQHLADQARNQKPWRFAIEALAIARIAEILARTGDWQHVEGVQELADQSARTAGALEIDLLCARILAQAVTGDGRVLSSIQPRAFARRLAQWTPTITSEVLVVDLDTADELANQRLFEPALALCQTVEQDARRLGRLVQFAEALTRRSRVHELQNDIAAALTCLREANRLCTVLGMRVEARLLQLRAYLLEIAAGGVLDPDDLIRAFDDLWPLLDQGRNERIACETLLALLESVDVEPQFGLDAAERISKYVIERGGYHLAVRLAVQQSRLLSAAGRIDEERSVIGSVLPWLTRVGNEDAAEELLARLVEIEQEAGADGDQILRLAEQAACIMRRTFGTARAIEEALARLRVKTGLVSALPSVADFLRTWQSHFPDLPLLLEQLAPAAGVSQVDDLARSLEEQFGAETAFSWLMWGTAVFCRQLRDAGEYDAALMVATGTRPMPLAFGDRQFSAILHNECGLDLLLLKHPDGALEQFTTAIADATAAGDLTELVDDHVNAADACEAMGRLDDAVEHLRHARQHLEARQDLQMAAAVALRLGELFKTLKRDQDAIKEFQTAEYLTRTLGRPEKIEQAVLRLGKLYWNVGEFEASIRYRHELIATYETRDDPATAAAFAQLVAITYDEQLDRPADAAHYCRRALALNEHARELDAAALQNRLDRCEARARDTRRGLWDTLLESEASPDSAEQTAARLAMAVDFNLWRFEPRSFCTWYERAFRGTVSYPVPVDRELPIWPFAAVYQLVQLAASAGQLHQHEDSLRHAHTADHVAQAFGIAQGRYLAAQASAATCAELGRTDLETEHLMRAQTIKREFDTAATARGLQTLEPGDWILEPWNQIGLDLDLKVRELLPSLSSRHVLVKSGFVEKFYMNPSLRQGPAQVPSS
jgi:tetratricopeptide (TPR) repeat protein